MSLLMRLVLLRFLLFIYHPIYLLFMFIYELSIYLMSYLSSCLFSSFIYLTIYLSVYLSMYSLISLIYFSLYSIHLISHFSVSVYFYNILYFLVKVFDIRYLEELSEDWLKEKLSYYR